MEYLEENLHEWLGQELEVGQAHWWGWPCECCRGRRATHRLATSNNARCRDHPAQGYGDDDYLVFDCPGQIELYNHLGVFRTFVDFLKQVSGGCWQRVLAARPPSGCWARRVGGALGRPAAAHACARAQDGWSVCVVYCLDAHFITDVAKYIAGAMQVGVPGRGCV